MAICFTQMFRCEINRFKIAKYLTSKLVDPQLFFTTQITVNLINNTIESCRQLQISIDFL